MIRIICKLPLVACLLVLFITPAHADVSNEGLYITVTIILGILFLPAIIVAISHRTRKKLYLMVLILWAVAAFLYLWFTGVMSVNYNTRLTTIKIPEIKN